MPIGPALEQLLNRLGLRARLAQQMVVHSWSQVAGREIARRTRALDLRRGTLLVRVESSVWAAQLAFFKAELIRRLNERAGAPVVRDIRWVVGGHSERRLRRWTGGVLRVAGRGRTGRRRPGPAVF